MAARQGRRCGPGRRAKRNTDDRPGRVALGRAGLGGQDSTQAVQSVQRDVAVRLPGVWRPTTSRTWGAMPRDRVGDMRGARQFREEGGLLVQLDPRDSQYALDEGELAAEQFRVRLGLDAGKKFRVEEVPEVEAASLALQLAEKNFHRWETLRTRNAIAVSDADQMETEYRSARQRYQLTLLVARQMYESYLAAVAHVATLRKALEDCSIRALRRLGGRELVAVGEQINSGVQATEVVTLVRIDPLRLSLTVPQQDIGRIEPGQTVHFEVDSFPNRTFAARVRFIAPVVTNDNRSMVVEALVPNPDHLLRPGLFVTAELQLDQQQPSSSCRRRPFATAATWRPCSWFAAA